MTARILTRQLCPLTCLSYRQARQQQHLSILLSFFEMAGNFNNLTTERWRIWPFTEAQLHQNMTCPKWQFRQCYILETTMVSPASKIPSIWLILYPIWSSTKPLTETAGLIWTLSQLAMPGTWSTKIWSRDWTKSVACEEPKAVPTLLETNKAKRKWWNLQKPIFLYFYHITECESFYWCFSQSVCLCVLRV